MHLSHHSAATWRSSALLYPSLPRQWVPAPIHCPGSECQPPIHHLGGEPPHLNQLADAPTRSSWLGGVRPDVMPDVMPWDRQF